MTVTAETGLTVPVVIPRRLLHQLLYRYQCTPTGAVVHWDKADVRAVLGLAYAAALELEGQR